MVRESIGWGHTQLQTHLKRLEELEYLLIHRGGRGQCFEYELLFEPPADEGQRFLARLIDVERLRRQYDDDRSGAKREKSGSGRGQIGPKSGASRASKNSASPVAVNANPVTETEVSQNAHR